MDNLAICTYGRALRTVVVLAEYNTPIAIVGLKGRKRLGPRAGARTRVNPVQKNQKSRGAFAALAIDDESPRTTNLFMRLAKPAGSSGTSPSRISACSKSR